MKYEMIFGDEKLFDGAPEEATHATKGGGFYKIENMSAKYVSDGIFNGIDVLSVGGYLIAERRIIKEPKRWTWEDKKAGLMPEVGACVFFGEKGKNVTRIAEFIGTGITDSVWCLKLRCGSYVFVESEIVNPIETPTEKAQREEDEFVSGIVFEYDKMPSSVLFEAGIRAAYRKLKGGE